MFEQLEAARVGGYVADEGELEIGARCVAAPLHPSMAL